MNVQVSTSVEVSVTPSGIQVGETLVTWGYLLEQPEVAAKIQVLLCDQCKQKG